MMRSVPTEIDPCTVWRRASKHIDVSRQMPYIPLEFIASRQTSSTSRTWCVNDIHAPVPEVVHCVGKWSDRRAEIRSAQEPSAFGRKGIRGKVGFRVGGIPRIEETFTLPPDDERGLCERAGVT